MDRRTFLANGARTSAVLAVAGVVPEADAHAALSVRAVHSNRGASKRALTVVGLTVNGAVNPIGVDPDDCSFAWRLRSSARGSRQSAYRIVLRRTDPDSNHAEWDSTEVVSARQAFVLYAGTPLAGDAQYEWTVRVRDGARTWSAPSSKGSFVTAPRPADWTAHWLHPASTSTQPNQVTYLRTVVNPPPGALVRATAHVAAGHTYQLWIGGEQAAFGPNFCFPDEQYSQSTDVTAFIRTGHPNALGLLHHWYGAGKGRPESAPGLLAQFTLIYADGRRVTYGTEQTWKERPAEWLPSGLRNTDAGDFIEHIDGRLSPEGWSTVDYDATGWSPTTVRGPVGTAPFTKLYAQRTRIVEQTVAPVSVRLLSTGSVVIDFGAVYAARPQVTFEHGNAGRLIPMHVGYLLDPDGQVSTVHGTQQTDLSFSYIQRDGIQDFQALNYLGFRYLQIDQPGEPTRADQVSAVARHAAMPDVPAATFSTPDRTLNAVWKLNTRSCLYCSHEQFVDTPTREQGPFLWDSANASEGVMNAYGDQNMSWQGLRDVARGQMRYWPDGRVNAIYPNGYGLEQYPIFTERYPEWLWRYYLATGDKDTAVLLYPTCQRIASYLWTGLNASTGLLAGFNENSNSDPFYGYDTNVAEDTTSNVLGVNAYRRIALLAQVAGDGAGALTCAQRADQLAVAINTRLTRSDGIYVDGLKPNGQQSGHASQEGNALALAYGIVPPDKVATVGAYVARLGLAVSPAHGLELLRGLAAARMPDAIVKTLTDASVPGWAHILAAGGTFTWEVWTPSDLIGDSMSHGWGSSALVAMKEALLGVTPLPPNGDGVVAVTIEPPSFGVGAARGSLPTIAGPIAVGWQRKGNRFSLEATIPPNAQAIVLLPAVDASEVRESGRHLPGVPGIQGVSSHNGQVTVRVESGYYRFTTMA